MKGGAIMVKKTKTLKLDVNEIDELKDLVDKELNTRMGAEPLCFLRILESIEKKLDKVVS